LREVGTWMNCENLFATFCVVLLTDREDTQEYNLQQHVKTMTVVKSR